MSYQSVLSRADQLQTRHDWWGAVETYRKALDSLKLGRPEIAETCEKMGYALYRSARQANDPLICKEKVVSALECYRKSIEVYAGEELSRTLEISRSKAVAALLEFWIETDRAKKKLLIDEAWELASHALKLHDRNQDTAQYARAYDQLALVAIFKFLLEWNFDSRREVLKEMVRHGANVVRHVSELRSAVEVARAYARTALFIESYVDLLDGEEREEHYKRASQFWTSACEASEETALTELSVPRPVPPWAIFWGLSFNEVHALCRKSVDVARITGDNLLLGSALNWLYVLVDWDRARSEDPANRSRLADETFQHMRAARDQFTAVSLSNPFGDYRAEVLLQTLMFETSPETRHDLLERAIEFARAELVEAEDTGFPERRANAHHTLSKAMAAMATTCSGLERRKLLEDALAHRSESLRIISQVGRYYWHEGVFRNNLAEIESELAGLLADSKDRKDLLEQAVRDKQGALELVAKDRKRLEGRGPVPQLISVGLWTAQYGNLLKNLGEISREEKIMYTAAETYLRAAESFQKIDNIVRTSECYWKAGQVYDIIGDHLEAAACLAQSSLGYKNAAVRIPQLQPVYNDYSMHLEALDYVERGLYHHKKRDYGEAADYFEKAATIQRPAERWSFLASYYRACAQFERAENLSQGEKGDEAYRSFGETLVLFNETRHLLETASGRLEDSEEEKIVRKLLEVVRFKERYLKGRLLLEEARTLHKKGGLSDGSQKYKAAHYAFEAAANASTSEEDRRESGMMAALCKAWSVSARAEAEASPQLYAEASGLFERTKELGQDPKWQMAVLGHSRFCKALEYGTRYLDAADAVLYSLAITQLESAADYYLEAGLGTAAEHAAANRLLLEARTEANRAYTEKDPDVKAKLLAVAERLLATSAESFEKSGHGWRRSQVLKVLDRVKEDRELADSILELLQSPSTFSLVPAVSNPSPSYAMTIVPEGLDHADLHALVLPSKRSLRPGETVEVKMQMINAGVGPATLVRLEEVVPEGFELVESPGPYPVENSQVELKGKRLDPLKVEELRLVLKSKAQGIFTLKPRVVYLDDAGNRRSRAALPAHLLVSPIVEFLVKSFVDDYMARRLSPESAGWRTLMAIVTSLQIPKSHVYGDARQGHSYGKPIAAILKAGLAESRVFPGERGRGGRILKIRVCYNQDPMKRIIEDYALRPLRG